MRLIHVMAVLVIIGLAAGTALMLREDPLEAKLMREFNQHKMAFSQFYTQYKALPGDMPNATEFWGIAGGETGNDAECYNVDSRTLDDPMRTCNGNGDELIYQKDGVADSSGPEWFRAWQHMVNAGVMQGSFSGKADKYPRGATPGVNVPESKLVEGAGYTLFNFHQLDHPHWFPGHYLGVSFGTPFMNVIKHHVETRGGAITAHTAQRLDSKFDDGNPRSGVIRSWRDLPQCIAAESKSDPFHYLSDDTVKGCGLFFAFRDPEYADFPMLIR